MLMIASAHEARDKIDALLLEGDVETALAVAQTLWVLCDTTAEFDSCLQHMEDFARGEAGPLGEGSDPDRVPESDVVVKLEDHQVGHLRVKLHEIRVDRLNNVVSINTPMEHLLAG